MDTDNKQQDGHSDELIMQQQREIEKEVTVKYEIACIKN